MLSRLFTKLRQAPNLPATTTANLVVCEPGKEPVHYVLNALSIDIGRSRKCLIRIDQEWVSRRHIELTYDRRSRGYIFHDLQSLNGTRINGVKTQKATLKHGDFLRIGNRIPAHFMILPLGVDPDPALFENDGGARPIRELAPDDATSRVQVHHKPGRGTNTARRAVRSIAGLFH